MSFIALTVTGTDCHDRRASPLCRMCRFQYECPLALSSAAASSAFGRTHRLAAGKSVPVGGRVSRWGMGPAQFPEHLDRRLLLARDRAGLVVLHARGHIRPPLPDPARRKLCSVQFPDDLLGRFHSSLAVSAAVSLLALGWFQQQDQISGQQWLTRARGANDLDHAHRRGC